MYNDLYNKKYLKSFRKDLRNNQTESEKLLWSKLKASQLGYKFRRQQSIGNYIVDFYCPNIKLIIEVDGITHEDESTFIKDCEKEEFLKNNNHTLLRFGDNEIFHTLNVVVETIYNTCKELNE